MSAPALNSPQRAAIHYLDGPLLVLAGAGSGKTRVITQKIAYLIRDAGISARNIAAITFTNKAAREMLARAGKLLPASELRGLTVSTFHALGMLILRKEAALIGYKPQFSILDSYDAAKIISNLLTTTDKGEIRRVQSTISRWKNDLIDAQHALTLAANEAELAAARVFLSYQETLRAYQAVDFDDLIRLPVEIFQTHSEALDRWQSRLRYLLIDEYQDTNTCQYLLVKLLTGIRGMFTAVGDDDQSIYAWRGANIENLTRLQHDFPTLHLIKLEQNYRSTVRILRAANSVISNNPKLFEKQLWSELGLGDPIHIVQCKDEEHEAETVTQRILAHKFECRTRYADYAVLYRGNHQARIVEQALRNHKIPYVLSGGQSFFDKAEIKDVLSYLRLLANEDDDPAFIRAITTPKRGIGTSTLEKLGTYAGQRKISLFAAVYEEGLRQHLQAQYHEPLEQFCAFIQRMQSRARQEPAGTVIRDLLEAIQFEVWLYEGDTARAAENKWKNVLDLVEWLAKKGAEEEKDLLALTQTIALITLLDGRADETPDAVHLSTLHASKGLEYGHVLLIGCEEGILPHQESIEHEMVEEERRLMYVGITRAQRSLTLTHCQKRKRAGEWQFADPSRFIDEIDPEDLRYFGRPGAEPAITREEGKQKLANLREMLAAKKSTNSNDS